MDHINTIWKILYNEEYGEILDPNKPENSSYINAMLKSEKNDINRFLSGAGKPLINRWIKRIKSNIAWMISNSDADKCNCSNCIVMREVRSLFILLMEAQQITDERNKSNA